MITEDYISFEVAKLLKEKGFDEPCLSFFWTEDSGFGVEYCDRPFTNRQLYSEQTLRPTLQMAMKWLREVHKLHIWIAHKLKQNKGLPWYYEIHNIETGTVVKIGDVVCGSYEAACEEAIKYCLEKLI